MNDEGIPPDPAGPLTPSDIGAVRATLDQIRAQGIPGAELNAILLSEDEAEHEEAEDGGGDITDTPYLRQLAIRAGARARHAQQWRPRYLAALSLAPFTNFAARAVNVNPKTVMLHRQRDPIFDEACLLAEDQGRSLVLASAWSAAVDGNLEPVYHQGVLVGHVRRYSDRMRSMMLQGLFPATFRPVSQVDVKMQTDAAGDLLDAARLLAITSTLTPIMQARHQAMIEGKKPAPLPAQDGFVRLTDFEPKPEEKSVNP